MQKPIYSPDDEQRLMANLWSPRLKNDPEAFVMYNFPWGQIGTPLEKFTGPRVWQRNILRRIRDHIASNHGKLDMTALREAVASGRGIGKSALVAWLIIWMLSTRIGSTVIVSANSEGQLRAVTWGELTKWVTMGLNAHWWEISATKLVPAVWLAQLVERDLKKGTRYWAAEGKLWSEESPDSYAGVHNYDGMMVIFDEASGIPDVIWSVAAGFFTENIVDRYWFAFSNPRRNEGYFYECFNNKSEFWGNVQIDARTVEGTDKGVYEQIISEYGEDSDEAKIEVYGEFPSAGEDQYISLSLVEKAINREKYKDFDFPVIVGIDPGKGKPDPMSIAIRQGRDILSIRYINEDDSEESLNKIINLLEEIDPDFIVVDEGGLGWAIVGGLRRSGYKNTKGINSSWSSMNPSAYGNKRAEMWAIGKKELKTITLPNDKKMKGDMIAPKRKTNNKGALMIESKKELKARGIRSTDGADAIWLTLTINPPKSEKYLRSYKQQSKENEFEGIVVNGVAGSWMNA